jgi:hypothetical protein
MTGDILADRLSLHPDAEVLICTKDGCFEITAAQADGAYQGKILLHAGAYMPADYEGPKEP